MNTLPEDGSAWVSGIYQLEITDPVMGGPGGVDNLQSTQLGNRTAWLKNRAMASLRMEAIKPVTGAYTVSQDDIGQVLSVHDPSSASIQLPLLESFGKNMPITIVVTDTGTSSVALIGMAGEIIEDFLGAGGVSDYPLQPGTRIVFIATETSWVVVLKTSPVIVSGYAVGDIAQTFAPVTGTSTRPGFLLADGRAVSRVTYANLFAVYGTIYGVGDGSTTFNLPDPRELFLRVSNIGGPLGGGSIDPARAFGSTEADQVGEYNMVIPAAALSTTDTGASDPKLAGGDDTSPSDPIVITQNAGKETRPKNITINVWIKY